MLNFTHRASESKQWKLNLRAIARQNATPRTLLPMLSRRGEKVHRPMTPGITTMMPPPTPDLAGNPIVKANCPE